MTSPNNGGCWFCYGDDSDCFSTEWDCFVHDKCAQEKAKENNPEALIMLREWGEISYEECSSRYKQWEKGES